MLTCRKFWPRLEHIALVAVAAGLFLSAHPLLAQTPAASPRKPNMIFILADDLGYGDLGCYGQTQIKTPNIDQLAADGMQFTSFYAGSAVGAPSRCALMTGKDTGHSRIRGDSAVPLQPGDLTVAEFLKNAGYSTSAFGVWGLGDAGTTGIPIKKGFDEWFGFLDQAEADNHFPAHINRSNVRTNVEMIQFDNQDGKKGRYSDDAFTISALNIVRIMKPDAVNHYRPFFLYVAYTIPHANDELGAKTGNGMELPENWIKTPDQIAVGSDVREVLEGKQGKAKTTGAVGRVISISPDISGVPGAVVDFGHGKTSVVNLSELSSVKLVPDDFPYTAESWPQVEKNKASTISRLDRYIGAIRAQLKKDKSDENTIIIFSSGNGAHKEGGVDPKFLKSNGPLRGIKRDLYEGGIRVPFIVCWPARIKPGTTSDEPFAFWDFLPTAAELAYQVAPTNIDGISFAPTLLGETQTNRHEFLYWEFHEDGFKQAVRMGDWKAVRFGVDGPLQLFNLKTDIGEKTDVAAANPKVVAKIETYLKTARTEDPAWPVKTAAETSTNEYGK